MILPSENLGMILPSGTSEWVRKATVLKISHLQAFPNTLHSSFVLHSSTFCISSHFFPGSTMRRVSRIDLTFCVFFYVVIQFNLKKKKSKLYFLSRFGNFFGNLCHTAIHFRTPFENATERSGQTARYVNNAEKGLGACTYYPRQYSL